MYYSDVDFHFTKKVEFQKDMVDLMGYSTPCFKNHTVLIRSSSTTSSLLTVWYLGAIRFKHLHDS